MEILLLMLEKKEVNHNHWYEYLMWRSDGQPAGHPTFSLVLFNHKTCDALQKQGRFVLNSSDINLNTALNEICNALDEDGLRNVVKNLEKQLHIFSSNIPFRLISFYF